MGLSLLVCERIVFVGFGGRAGGAGSYCLARSIVSWTIKALDIFSDDFNDFAIGAIAGGVLATLQSPVHRDQPSLRQVIRDEFSSFIPAIHAEEICVWRSVGGLDALIDGNSDVANALARLGSAQFGVPNKAANENDSI